MNNNFPNLLFVILSLLATAPFSHAEVQQPTKEQLARILKRFPEVDKDKDGKLSTEEFEAFRDANRDVLRSQQYWYEENISCKLLTKSCRNIKIENSFRRFLNFKLSRPIIF